MTAQSDRLTHSAVAPAAQIAVIGLGYIGLPTAVSLATGGLTVVGVDTNPAIVEQVRAGTAPFEEPDLAVALSGAVTMGRLSAVTQAPAADAFVIAVPTPFLADKKPDLSYVLAAAESIASVLRGGEIVVVESTVPPGTTERVSKLIATLRPDLCLPHEPLARRPSPVPDAACSRGALPGASAARQDHDRDRDQRQGHRRPDSGLLGQGRGSLPDVLPWRAASDGRHQRRDGEARRERLPGRQHRVRQRTRADLPRAGP